MQIVNSRSVFAFIEIFVHRFLLHLTGFQFLRNLWHIVTQNPYLTLKCSLKFSTVFRKCFHFGGGGVKQQPAVPKHMQVNRNKMDIVCIWTTTVSYAHAEKTPDIRSPFSYRQQTHWKDQLCATRKTAKAEKYGRIRIFFSTQKDKISIYSLRIDCTLMYQCKDS